MLPYHVVRTCDTVPSSCRARMIRSKSSTSESLVPMRHASPKSTAGQGRLRLRFGPHLKQDDTTTCTLIHSAIKHSQATRSQFDKATHMERRTPPRDMRIPPLLQHTEALQQCGML